MCPLVRCSSRTFPTSGAAAVTRPGGAGFGGIELAKADEPMLIGRDVADVLEYERTFPSARQALTGSAQHKPAS
jgi:hypothetical protein